MQLHTVRRVQMFRSIDDYAFFEQKPAADTIEQTRMWLKDRESEHPEANKAVSLRYRSLELGAKLTSRRPS